MASGEGDAREYDTTYRRFADDVYASMRREVFGEDIGQNSWLTADEQRIFCEWLGLGPSSELLEVASGSGGPALFTAETTGCRVTGVDIHEAGVTGASDAARERGLAEQVRFVVADAREGLPFGDESFDAVICVDSINHLYERTAVLAEWYRVVRSGGRILFTDPITVTGFLRREEMIVRSGGMGEFVFTPAGLDERSIGEAGFVVVSVEDRSENPAWVGDRWHAARARRTAELDELEGAEQNARRQEFFLTVANLARERRLSRFAYLARRP